MSRWFRFYDDAVNDPKVQRLAPELFRAWVNLLCIVSKSDGALPSTAEIAFTLRIKPAKVQVYITALTVAGLLDCNEDGTFGAHNWNARQYKSDVADPTAPLRQKAYRERIKNRNATVTVTDTRADTEQITETDQSREKRARRATRLPNDWVPNEIDLVFAANKGLAVKQIEIEALKFLNYWTAKSGQSATKTDWSKTWQNWILTATQGVPTNGRRTIHDAARELHEQTVAAVLAFDEPAPRGLCDGTGDNPVRLLSSR